MASHEPGYKAAMAGVLVGPRAQEGGRANNDDEAGEASSLVVVAHRGPVRFAKHYGARVVKRSSGGLVTALRDLTRCVPGTRFLCAATSDEERRAAAEGWQPVPFGDASCTVRMLEIDPDAHHGFYAVIANPLLWFIQHSLWRSDSAPAVGRSELDAWDRGYTVVNEQFARALSDRDEVPAGAVVMIHDYHFYLVPEMVRRSRPDLFLHFFVHIPWPQPDAWRVLPERLRQELFRGVLGSDIVGFHTKGYAENFLFGCEELLGLEVDHRRASVRVDGRTVAVRSYPISVDESTLQALAASPETARHERELDAAHPEKLVVRVDRTDPSKNIVRGFRAFDRMLDTHPDLEERVTFLALLQPSRQDVAQYVNYLGEIERTVTDVNSRRRRPGWEPIDLRLGDDLALAVAAYKHFDVLMVNALCDGMNLVCKEALLTNESDGVVALSEHAGAHDELGEIVVTLDPFDVEQQAESLYVALTMPQAERCRRRVAGSNIVRSNDSRNWL